MTHLKAIGTKQQQPTETSPVTISDTDLVNSVLAGNKQAFEPIVRMYNQRLFRVARSIVKQDDEAQESYIKAYFQLESCRNPDKLGAWLSRIVSNEAVSRLRKGKNLEYDLDVDAASDIVMKAIQPQTLDTIANRQLRDLIEKAIDQLAVKYRSVYILRAVEQLDTRETADSLDLSEDVVKTRFTRAKKMLRHMFQTHLDKANLSAHEFAGHRCDAIVAKVKKELNISQSN